MVDDKTNSKIEKLQAVSERLSKSMDYKNEKFRAEYGVKEEYNDLGRKFFRKGAIAFFLGLPFAFGGSCLSNEEIFRDKINDYSGNLVVAQVKTLDESVELVRSTKTDLSKFTYKLPLESESVKEDLIFLRDVDNLKKETLESLERKLVSESTSLKTTKEFKDYKAEDRAIMQNANYSLLGGWSLILGSFVYLVGAGSMLSRRKEKKLDEIENSLRKKFGYSPKE